MFTFRFKKKTKKYVRIRKEFCLIFILAYITRENKKKIREIPLEIGKCLFLFFLLKKL